MSGWILFLERELPTTTGTEQLLSDKQSAIRPRVLTVERRNATAIQKVREVLAHPQVRNVLDPDKTGVDEADPYVLGLAVFLKDQGEVTIITEERKDRPGKMSLNTACGLLRLYCLSMEPFLAQQKIWP